MRSGSFIPLPGSGGFYSGTELARSCLPHALNSTVPVSFCRTLCGIQLVRMVVRMPSTRTAKDEKI